MLCQRATTTLHRSHELTETMHASMGKKDRVTLKQCLQESSQLLQTLGMGEGDIAGKVLSTNTFVLFN